MSRRDNTFRGQIRELHAGWHRFLLAVFEDTIGAFLRHEKNLRTFRRAVGKHLSRKQKKQDPRWPHFNLDEDRDEPP